MANGWLTGWIKVDVKVDRFFDLLFPTLGISEYVWIYKLEN